VFDIKVENFFNFMSDEYADLFAKSGVTPFQHPLWLDRLYGTLAPQLGADPLVIAVRSQRDGRLRMILPLLRQRRALMTVIEFADLGVSDYASPVCDDQTFDLILHDDAACGEIQNALKPYDLLRFQKLRGNTERIEQLLSVPSVLSMNMSAHVVTLQQSYPEWRANSIGPSYRKELNKKRRQLQRKGRVQFECSGDAAAIRSTFESMRRYRLPRFEHAGDRDLLQQPLYFDFYLDVARSGATSGIARTYTLSIDGRTIAGVMGLAHQGQFLVLLGGFDHASFKNQSIGALMFEDVGRDCIERGDTVLDFTIGDEPYKQLFGAEPTEMWMFTKAGSRLGSLASFVVAQVPGAKNFAKRFIERKPKAIAERADDRAPVDAVSARPT
jgi:CelD/BcsL family acetyltransferase involved in cellulose biosynthesis